MTPTTELCKIDEELIKTDSIGRISVSNEYREKLLDTFETSGMSGQQFADHCGVKYTTFATWLQKRRRARNEYPAEHAATPENLLRSLAEVELTPAKASNESLSIELPGGARLTLDHPEQAPLAAALIHNLSNQNNAQL
jgi:hypothetical protein